MILRIIPVVYLPIRCSDNGWYVLLSFEVLFQMVFNVRKRRKGRQALDRIIPAKGEYERNISFASMNTYETNANLDQ